MDNKRLSIFVDSYDGNKDLWKNLFDIFDHFWSNCPYERFLVTNNESFQRKNLMVIKTGDEIDWFTTTIIALKQINTKYVWLFLDDYYLSKKIINDDVEEILDYMDTNNVFFYRLSLRGDLDKKVIRHQITGDFVYAINLQPVIWNREKFLYYLEKLHDKGCKSPWEFEKYFIKYFENKNSTDVIPGVIYDTRDIMGYKNAIIQGKWVRHVVIFFKKKFGIIIDTGNRSYMSYRAELFDFIKRKGHSVFKYEMRQKIKNHLSKVGLKFMTR